MSELIVLCLCQFPGFDNVQWLGKILLLLGKWGEAYKGILFLQLISHKLF